VSDHDLAGFTRDRFTHAGVTHELLRRGDGPAVIVIAEMPGITPKVLEFAERVVARGCTVVLPVLFGEPGRDPNPAAHSLPATVGYAGSTILRACVSREFVVWATGKTSPVVEWLRALARNEHERCGGPGVGAVGMCFTGGYALAMAADDVVLAPVLSQPSMPVAITPAQKRSIDISPADLDAVKLRCANDGLKVLGLRFKSDRFVPAARFDFLREQLGDAFVAVELEDRDANPDSMIPPHSVLTEHLIDAPGQATRAALDQVLELFAERLLTTSPDPR
jgi:dienelactone hydrolase